MFCGLMSVFFYLFRLDIVLSVLRNVFLLIFRYLQIFRHEIAGILLKVALNTTILTLFILFFLYTGVDYIKM